MGLFFIWTFAFCCCCRCCCSSIICWVFERIHFFYFHFQKYERVGSPVGRFQAWLPWSLLYVGKSFGLYLYGRVCVSWNSFVANKNIPSETKRQYWGWKNDHQPFDDFILKSSFQTLRFHLGHTQLENEFAKFRCAHLLALAPSAWQIRQPHKHKC